MTKRKFFGSYEEFARSLSEREYFGQKLGLARMRTILERLDHPERKFRSIHVAGTNGKGSTCAMISQVLEEAGYRVGLYTSPHLEDFCERIQINHQKIFPQKVLDYVHHICRLEDSDDTLTFFELATVMAFLYFSEARVDFAVIETGLGGRLDATNVITPLLSVITNISRDHAQHLGHSIAEIAFEKSGIIKSGIPVLTGPLDPEAMEVIRDQAALKSSRFIPMHMNLLPPNIIVGLEGAHQRQNASLASAAVDLLTLQSGEVIPREAVWSGLRNVIWPGRLEQVSERPLILMDGAHNPEGMRSLVHYLEEKLQGRKLKVVFGAMKDKEVAQLLDLLSTLTHEFVLPEIENARASTPEELSLILDRPAGSPSVRRYVSVSDALKEEMSKLREDEVLVITGSLYLIGEARQFFRQTGVSVPHG